MRLLDIYFYYMGGGRILEVTLARKWSLSLIFFLGVHIPSVAVQTGW